MFNMLQVFIYQLCFFFWNVQSLNLPVINQMVWFSCGVFLEDFIDS